MAAKPGPKKAETKKLELPAKEQPGLTCRKCGCQHFVVCATWFAIGVVRRRRACRNCGAQYPTVELLYPEGQHAAVKQFATTLDEVSRRNHPGG